MADKRIVELSLAALIQYAGASVRRRYEQAVLIMGVVSPGLRARLDAEVGKDTAVAKVIGDAAAGLLERVSDLSIAVVSWVITAYQVAWAAFGLLAEAALGTVASLIREGTNFDLAKHGSEFKGKWSAFVDRLNEAFDAQYTWTMTRQLRGVPLNEFEVVATGSAGPIVTFSFCSQERPYRDGGRRIDFRLRDDGILEMRSRAGDGRGVGAMSDWRPITQAISFNKRREGTPPDNPLLRFDMLAASNDRVFVKVRGTADYYFATPAEMFAGTSGPRWNHVPTLYFKLDPVPEALDSAGLVGQLYAEDGKRLAFSPTHPQAERIPLLHEAFAAGVLPAMIVSVKPLTLYRLDTRPPRLGIGDPPDLRKPQESARRALKLQLANQFIGYPLPGGVGGFRTKTIDHHAPFYDLVLSIGVGNFHFYESWNEDHGGEIQWLRKIGWQGLPINSSLYGTFNGPIADGDGAVDGTCNFYLLVRLRREDGSARFGILWCDEQTFFTKRWRLADPRDIEPWALKLPNDVNLSVHAMLRNDRAKSLIGQQYNFSEDAFLASDPFEQGWIDERSRMAVARQVLIVNGRNDAGPRLFSINYSYGSVDTRWRSRRLPEVAVRAKGDPSDLGLEPESLHLREDMTISIAGRSGPEVTARSGRWFQRYLPCQRMHPAKEYAHPWRFLPQATWDRLAQFSHFGVLADVDSRAQFYSVSLLSVDGVAAPGALQLAALDGALVEDGRDQLFIRARKFKWGAFNDPGKVAKYLKDELPGKISSDSEIESLLDTMFFDWHAKPDPTVEYRQSRSSMFNKNAQFRLLRRGALGWMLVWDDKRDDDLVSLSDLPIEVELSVVEAGLRMKSAQVDAPNTKVTALPTRIPGGAVNEARRVRLRLVRNTRVTLPPCVERVRLDVVEGTDCWARLSLETPLPLSEALFNLWKCHVAYWPADAAGPVRISGDGLLIETCAHEALPSGGMRFIAGMPLLPPTECRRIFTRDEADIQGLCIWFENAIGQVSMPDDIVFA